MAQLDLPTLFITDEHVHGGEYVGSDVSSWQGNIVLLANLGMVHFNTKIGAKGFIYASYGSGIETDENVSAGKNITIALGLNAKTGVKAGGIISVG